MNNISVNPEIISWARIRNGFTINTLAEKIKIDPSEISLWEKGEKEPSYTLLENLAYKYFKIPIAVFFFSQPPDIEDPRNNFRRLPDYELKRFSYDTLQKLRLGQAYQESLVELIPRGNYKNKIFKEVDSSGLSASQLAHDVREYLGVTVEKQSRLSGQEAAFKYWRRTLEDVGIFTFKDTFKDKFISGFSLLHNECPIIFINNSTSFSRQIFTLIHELGHILLGVYGVSDIDETYMEHMNIHEKKLEIRCNRFAADFLVPEELFNKDIAYYRREGLDSIPAIANKYSVSKEVILRKMLDHNVINAITYKSLSAKWNKDYLRVKGGKNGGNYYLTRLSYLGEGFTQWAFKSYSAGRINSVELANHLNVKARSLKKLGTYIRL